MSASLSTQTAQGRRTRYSVRAPWAENRADFLIAVGVVGLHIADDNFLQPEPGTSAGDHLASGLIPLAVLAVVAAVYPRLRAGLRAITAMTLGALAITVGVPAVYYLLDGKPPVTTSPDCSRSSQASCFILSAPVTLWRARRTDGSRRRRYLRRTLIVLATPLLAWAIAWFLVFPIGFAYIYAHTGRAAVTPDLGVPYETVTVVTSDSLDSGRLVRPLEEPCCGRALPGCDPIPGGADADPPRIRRPAARPPRAGLERRRHRALGRRSRPSGRSRISPSRPDVDPDRIGGFGFSIGGEILIEAAAQSTAFKAIVTEGAGSRVGDEDVKGPARLFAEPNLALMTAALTVFSNHGPPPPIESRISRIAPRAVFLIHADPGWAARTREGRSTTQPLARRRRSGRCPAQSTPAAYALAPLNTSVASSTSSTTHYCKPTRRPHMRIEQSFSVSRPPEVVFDYLTNPANLAAWQTSKTSVEQLTAGAPRSAHASASARRARVGRNSSRSSSSPSSTGRLAYTRTSSRGRIRSTAPGRSRPTAPGRGSTSSPRASYPACRGCCSRSQNA